MAQPALRCGNCGDALRVLQLAGHYGTEVEIDLCAPCHLVWFDAIESARLAGPGLLALIGEMAGTQALPHQALRASPPCPRCSGPVRMVHNQTRWGKSQQLECTQRHGAYQSFAQFLTEKGLLRPMSSADRQRALQRDGAIHCVNCGGAIDAGHAHCPWCQSVPSVFDVARLARALDPEGATQRHAVHDTQGRAGALGCQACGSALPVDAGWTCPQCQTTVTTPGLGEAHRLVSALGPALQAHALRPAAHVVRQRLAAQDGGIQRQRDRAREMQAEADARNGRTRHEPAVSGIELVEWVATAWHALRRWWR